MSRSAREVWEERVRRLGESNLTIGEFAAELGINAHTLSYWKWRLGKEGLDGKGEAKGKKRSRRRARKATFVEVQPTAPVVLDRPRVDVVLDNGAVVRVPDDFEPETLRRIVATLESPT